MSELKSTINRVYVPRSFGTHDGSFHGDEVTACAFLLLFDLIDYDKIIRSRKLDLLNKCEFICDVGGVYDSQNKLFDHHQVEYQGMLSSVGMVLEYLKETGTITPKEHEFFNNALVLGVDAHDNGKDLQSPGVCTYSHIISNFTPIPHEVEPEVQDKAFFEALDFSTGHLKRLWQRYQYVQSCRQIVADAMSDKKEYLLFDKSIPWLDIFFEMGGLNHQAKFVIMPSGEHWKLRGIPPTIQEKMKVRIPLPLEWAGLLDEELKKTSGIPGAIFCHKGRFISVWEKREDALKAFDYVMEKQRQENGAEK